MNGYVIFTGPAAQRAPGATGRSRVPACLQAGTGVEAVGLTLPLGSVEDWLKFKNPDAPAVKREVEEDWRREQWR